MDDEISVQAAQQELTKGKEPKSDEAPNQPSKGEAKEPQADHQPKDDKTLSYLKFEQPKEPVSKLSCEILTANETKDPSYTNLTLPYYVICRQRYQRAGIKQRRQFLKEIRKQEISQSKALSGVRIHRVFLDPVLTPARANEIIMLTPSQQFKLEQLLNE